MGRPPRRFGPYVLERELDGDDQHEVFLAQGEGDDEVILAFVKLDADTASAVREDLDRSRNLRHPAILNIIDLVEEDGRQALVHPAVNGRTLARLAEMLKKDDEWIADTAIFHIGQQIAAALATAQRTTPPLVHGCLTPERVIISLEGRVQLIGLGSAAAWPDVPSEPWRGFAAPEVRAGEPVTTEANTYALGALLWWLATRESPPEQGTPASLGEARKDLSGLVTKAIDRALSEVPGQRGKAAMLAGALMRQAKGGQQELKWNMEVFQALDRFDDVLPSSIAFPTSFPPASSEAPPSSEKAPAPKKPPPRPRLDSLGRIGLPKRPPRVAATKPLAAKKAPVGKKPLRAKKAGVKPDDTTPESAPPSSEDPEAAVPTKLRPPPTHLANLIGGLGRAADAPASDEASTKRRPTKGMFDVGDSQPPAPTSDRTEQMSVGELQEMAKNDRITQVGTLEEIEKALDAEEEASTKRSRVTSPDVEVELDADEDEGVDDEEDFDDEPSRDAMFPLLNTKPPASDEEPTKRVPLGVLKAEAEAAQRAEAAHRLAAAPGAPVLLGAAAADPHHAKRPPPAAPPAPGKRRKEGPSLAFALIIAITAIAAFSAGIFVVRGLDAPAPTPTAPPSATAPAPTPAPPQDPTPAPSQTAPPPATAAPSATAEPAASGQPNAEPEGSDGEELPEPGYKKGLLRVTAPIDDATVYWRGKPVGKLGKILVVGCGTGFVRLGDDPLTKWYNDGNAASVPCKKVLTEVSMKVKAHFKP